MDRQTLKGLNLLITRPQRHSRLQHQLVQLGAKADCVPMLSIDAVPASIAPLQSIPYFHRVIFTSRSAVRYIEPLWPEIKLTLTSNTKILAVGKSTQCCAQQLGLGHVITPKDHYNSEGLLSLDELNHIEDKNILLITGVGGRALLQDTLTQRQARVIRLNVYQRSLAQLSPEAISELTQKAYDLVILTSGESLHNFFRQMGLDDLQLSLVVISDRMVALARQAGFKGDIIQAKNALDDSIIQAIIQWRERLNHDDRK